MNKNTHLLYWLFSISGFSGLIYQSVWSHYIKLVLGHAAYAQTLVLIIFMGGMAIGAWLISILTDRITKPLLFYAAIEVIIGVFGLLFHHEFIFFHDLLFNYALPFFNSLTTSIFIKWLIASLLLLPQAVLLGATFPIMSSYIIRTDQDNSGRTLGILYFSNTIGAAIGVLMSGFILIELLGLAGTSLTAGVINILLAAIVWVISKRSELASQPQKEKPQTTNITQSSNLLLSIAMLTGIASFFYEIGWIRMLSLVLSSSIHAFELMLSAFIGGLAFGSYFIKKRIDSLTTPDVYLAWIQILMGFFAIATLPLYIQSFSIMSFLFNGLSKSNEGYILFNIGSQVIALLVMFPATFMAGMTLPLLTNMLLKSGGSESAIGRIYSANTFGAIIGVIVAIHIIMPLTGVKSLIIIGGSIDIIIGLAILYRHHKQSHYTSYKVILASILVLSITFSLTPFSKSVLSSGVYRFGKADFSKEHKILSYEDGKTSSVSLVKFPDNSISIMTNGKTDANIASKNKPASPDEITMVLLGILPLSIHPTAKTIANIGMGSGLTTHNTLAADSITSVDTIEIEKAMVTIAEKFGSQVERTFKDPRSHIHIDDAKSFFSNHQKTYDIIISEPSNPWMSGVASLFSYEFYHDIQKHINPDGIFIQWLQLYEINIDNVASVIKALDKSFEDFHLYNTDGTNILIIAGSHTSLQKPDPWVFNDQAIFNELQRANIKSLSDIEMRYLGDKQLLSPLFSSFSAPMNSDYYPYLGYQAPKSRYLNNKATEITHLHFTSIPVINWLNNIRPSNDINTKGNDFPFANFQLIAKSIVEDKPETINSPLLKLYVTSVHNPKNNTISDIEVNAFQLIASSINPYLPADLLDNYWKEMRKRYSLIEDQSNLTNWLSLHHAISQYDAEKTLMLAEELLPYRRSFTKAQSNYLITAILTACIANKDYQKALHYIQMSQLHEQLEKRNIELKLLIALTDQGLK